jgi:hypothetical protein
MQVQSGCGTVHDLRTNFTVNFIRDLSTNIRDFSAMNLQSKRGHY